MQFNIYANARLIKSEQKGGEIVAKVGGTISTEDLDADGEKVLTKGLDLSYFQGGWGKIKFEHDTRELKEPDNVIGFPTKIFRKSNQLDFEGELVAFNPSIPDEELTPQQRTAKSAYGLLKSIDDHNQRNPHIPQKAGWSIEGDYLDRDRRTGLVKAARITNVVLTTKPKNTATMATLIKSLTAGYEVNPESMTGYEPLKKESIAGTTKYLSNKTGATTMYTNKAEAKAALLKKGLSEEEAEKKANEMFPENKGEALENFGKSIGFANQAFDIDSDLGIENLNKSMKKSLSNMDDEGSDVTEYFKTKATVDLAIVEGFQKSLDKQDLLAKSIAALASGFTALAEENQFLRKSLGDLSGKQERLDESIKIANTILLKGIQGQLGANSAVSDLIQKSVGATVENNKSEVGLEKMNKSLIADTLFDLYSQGKVSGNEVTLFDANGGDISTLSDTTLGLLKSTINTMQK